MHPNPMSRRLDHLPFDVLFLVLSYLNIEDSFHLGQTCKYLSSILQEGKTCRRLVETRAKFSYEHQLANDGQLNYPEAARRIFDRRRAFATANPFSAFVVGYGTSFIYHDGTLCYFDGYTIHVQDMRGCSKISKCFNIRDMLQASFHTIGHNVRLGLLHYNEGILTLLAKRSERQGDNWLIAVDTDSSSEDAPKILAIQPLRSTYKLVVRNSKHYLYYGTFTGTGNAGHSEWIFQLVSLFNDNAQYQPLQLQNVLGSDVGSTVAFEVHQGYFYAVSNETHFRGEGGNWINFYHCIRFPVDNPTDGALEVNDRVYRRKHTDGTIHDWWTDLALKTDEHTGELLIVEHRREWLIPHVSEKKRTFYQQRMTFASDVHEEHTDSGPPSHDTPLEVPVELSPCSDLAEFEREQYMNYDLSNKPLKSHPEYGFSDDPPHFGTSNKFRTYNLSCSTFLDIIQDTRQYSSIDPTGITVKCLRLRVGSRSRAPLASQKLPAEVVPSSASKGKEKAKMPRYMDCGRYRYSRITLWPPEHRTQLPSIFTYTSKLEPDHLSGTKDRWVIGWSTLDHSLKALDEMDIKAAADERLVVIMPHPKLDDDQSKDFAGNPIIVVSFDPGIKAEDFQPVRRSGLPRLLAWAPDSSRLQDRKSIPGSSREKEDNNMKGIQLATPNALPISRTVPVRGSNTIAPQLDRDENDDGMSDSVSLGSVGDLDFGDGWDMENDEIEETEPPSFHDLDTTVPTPNQGEEVVVPGPSTASNFTRRVDEHDDEDEGRGSGDVPIPTGTPFDLWLHRNRHT